MVYIEKSNVKHPKCSILSVSIPSLTSLDVEYVRGDDPSHQQPEGLSWHQMTELQVTEAMKDFALDELGDALQTSEGRATLKERMVVKCVEWNISKGK